MAKSAFDPTYQQQDLASKVVVGLERISEAFRSLLWEHAKVIGLSPIQIQILIFTAYHPEGLRTVSYLAREFNVTKPTISDAIRVLANKSLIKRERSIEDSRSYAITLTESGQEMVTKTEQFAYPIQNELTNLPQAQLESLFQATQHLIRGLNQAGVLNVQRSCHGCRFYEKQGEQHYCHFLSEVLANKDIRLDCPEYQIEE